MALAGGAATSLAADPLEILVTGTIEKNCRLTTTSSDIELGRVDRPGQTSFEFEVSCNTPFTYEIRSTNGALVQSSGLLPVGNFDDRVPYWIRLTLPLEDGDLGGFDIVCTSEELAKTFSGCGTGDSGSSIAIDRRATVTVSWSEPRNPLLAGEYLDGLTFAFGVKP